MAFDITRMCAKKYIRAEGTIGDAWQPYICSEDWQTGAAGAHGQYTKIGSDCNGCAHIKQKGL